MAAATAPPQPTLMTPDILTLLLGQFVVAGAANARPGAAVHLQAL